MEVTLKMQAAEANFLLQALGNLPTSSNAWPLMQKISQQAEACVAAVSNPPPPEQKAEG
jgi:hypothetical protein